MSTSWYGEARPKSGSEQAPTTFTDVFAQYRGILAEDAVRTFASWSEDRILKEAVLAGGEEDPWARAALATLHLEALLARAELRTDTAHILFHHHLGEAHIERVLADAKSRGDSRLLAFCRDWYIVSSTGLRRPKWNLDGLSHESARTHLAADADIQLLLGTYWSNRMGPRRSDGGGPTAPYGFGPGPGERVISVRGEVYREDDARDAERALRQALTINPSLAEARLRLGRFLQVMNRQAVAQAELVRASADALLSGDRDSAYLAELFLGELHEEAGRTSDAVTAYNAAISRNPAGTTARLALGQALIAAGRADEGWAATRAMFGADAQPPDRDPWSLYPSVNYWRIERRLSAMRAAISKTPFTGATAPSLMRAFRGTETPSPIQVESILPTARKDMFFSRVDGVRIEVLVTDGGRAISGLTAADFVVSDNNVRQEISRSAATTALSVALVLDTSDSMVAPRQWRRVQTAAALVGRALAPGDVLSVVTASDRLALRADQMREASVLAQVLDTIQPELRSLSAAWDGVLAGSALVIDAPGRGVVVLVSDGMDNASWFERKKALALLPRLGIVLDAVSIPFGDLSWDSSRDLAPGTLSLRPVESATGGMYFDVTDPDLARKLSNRFTMLRQSYILMYSPENVKPQKDGWHEVKVTLRPGLKGRVQARAGYYAPPQK